MRKYVPQIAMLTGFVSFIGIIYMMLNPDLPSIWVFLIYILAACAGASGLYLMGRKDNK